MRWAYFTVFTICIVVVAYYASQSFANLSTALRKSTETSMDNERKEFELRIADLKTEIASMKGEIALLRAGITRAVEIAGENSESLTSIFARIEENIARMPQMRQQGEPFMDIIQETIRLTREIMMMFGEQSSAKMKADGKYWKDGEIGLLDRIEFPRDEFDMLVRYFASPEQDKYTLVIMPSHRKIKQEIREKYPNLAFAITSSGAIYICKNAPVDMPEKFNVQNWGEDDNLPQPGEWGRFDENAMRPNMNGGQQPMRPEQLQPNKPNMPEPGKRMNR